VKFHTVFQYHYFLTFIFLKLNTYSFVLSFVQTYDFCMYMHIFCFCVYIQRCVRDTSLWQLKLLTLFFQCHKVSPIHFIVLRIGYIKKPFQLDDYSIDMGGMNLDIFPKKKKQCSPNCTYQKQRPPASTFINTGHFIQITNGTAQHRLEPHKPRLYHYYRCDRRTDKLSAWCTAYINYSTDKET
jgi:hypothetical protein